MKKVADRLSILKMDTAERNAYFHYLKEAVQAQDTLTSAKLEGERIGIEKGEKIGIEKGKVEGEKIGIEKEKMQIAQNMLQLGLPLDTIAAVTGLSVEVIQSLPGDCY